MRTRYQVDRQAAAVALKTGMPTPGHAAAEAGLAADEAGHEAGHEDQARAARRRRERVQHEAEPYPDEVPDVDRFDVGELGKLHTQAVDVPEGYPPMRLVDAEQFRRGPAAAGHAANSPGYAAPGRPVPVPSAT